LNSGNPKELVDALKAVMKNIERRVFSSSGVAINGSQLYQKLTSGLLLFQGSYSSEGWTGDLKAFNVDEISGDVDVLNPAWSAAQNLDLKVKSSGWDSRLIASYNGSSGIPFRFDSLADTQKSMIDADWATDSIPARNIMDYLHGDTSNEVRNGGGLRSRFSALGDIVHSTPAFKNGLVYTGANDGMLHAFDADTGEELFAYVPNLVFANLKYLAEIDYAHRYYVDLDPCVRDVTLPGVTTMLVGGLGKGGRGYFALDISGLSPAFGDLPASESVLADRVMWEYPDAATLATEVEDLGYSFSKVALVKSNDTNNAPWVVIFGNGYNSVNGHAVLFILDPTTGDLLKRIDTGVGDCNGLSTPFASDVDHNGTVDYVYAGDLKGNLWKFDLTSTNFNDWDVAYKESTTPEPLFKTPGQPITTRPDATWHCEQDGYLVMFGTGRYLGLADLTDNSQQAVYGIWDYGDDEDDGEYVGAFDGSTITGSNLPDTVSLLQQIVVVPTDDPYLRTLSAGEPDWKATTDGGAFGCGDNEGTDPCDPNSTGTFPDPVKHAGWFFNLPESGERVVSDVQVRDGKLTLVSYVNEGSTCGLAGHSWFMTIDPCTGGRLKDVYFDISGDFQFDDQDLINIGTAKDPIMVPPIAIQISGKVEMPTYVINKAGGYEKIIIPDDAGNPGGSGGPGGPGGGGAPVGKEPFEGMTYWRMLR
jgi:type IV pilus assembly protein PilY1